MMVGMGGGWFVWLIALLLFLLLVGGLIAVVVWLVSRGPSGTHSASGGRASGGRASGGRASGEDAMDVLRRRYANGEISREEYQRMRQDLQG